MTCGIIYDYNQIFRDVVFDMMVDDREGEVAAALSRLARRYFSPNISIWVFQYFHLSISILASNF